MSDSLPIKIKRVFKEDRTSRPIAKTGFILGTVPENGFIIAIEGTNEIPLYVRDSDLKMAKEASSEKKKSVAVMAVSWNSPEGDQDEQKQ